MRGAGRGRSPSLSCGDTVERLEASRGGTGVRAQAVLPRICVDRDRPWLRRPRRRPLHLADRATSLRPLGSAESDEEGHLITNFRKMCQLRFRSGALVPLFSGL